MPEHKEHPRPSHPEKRGVGVSSRKRNACELAYEKVVGEETLRPILPVFSAALFLNIINSERTGIIA